VNIEAGEFSGKKTGAIFKSYFQFNTDYMLDKGVVKYNAIAFGICGLLSLAFGFTGLGTMSIIFAFINIFLALIFFLSKQNGKGKSCLLVGGCLLLIGFALCSLFPFQLNH
jgi:hypothetical protein